MLALSLAVVCSVLSAAIPEIRYTTAAPFDAEGKRVESVWKKADTCVRFVTVKTMDVAIDQSEAQLLFDDKNLYVSMTGFFDPRYECSDRKNSMGSSNNFELLVKPEGGSIFHVIVDEFGRTYFAKDKSEVRDSGASVRIEKGKGRWTANVTIPMAVFGIASPPHGLKARVGIFRQNLNVHERQVFVTLRKTCEVSGYTPNNYNFSVSDNWAEMAFAREEGTPRRVVGSSMGYRINLFANPDFDVPGRCWSPMGKTSYQETQAMSGEWIYHASGKDYQVLQAKPFGVKPSTKYTLVVKARSFGAGSGLRVVEMARNSKGKIYEGKYVTMLTPVGPDMHEYYLPFTSAPDPLWTMVFYKVDSKAEDTGIDFASIRLYEGEISSFEIRKMVRPGRMAPIAGTEIPVPPSEYGRMAKPLRALVVVESKYLTREPRDIFEGTGAALDVLLAQSKDQDVYTTDGDPDAITKRLEKGEYDLYMIPKNGATKVGKELAAKILANVEKGVGLYLEDSKDYLHFKAVAKKGGALGKGHVFLAKTAGGYQDYLPAEDYSEYGKSFLQRRRFLHPQVVADAVRTAFGDVAIPNGAKTREESFVYGGVKHVATWTLDAHGRTLAWNHEAVPVAGAKLGAFDDDGETTSVAVDGDVTGLTLMWVFTDFSGRILANGNAPAAAKVSFKVPRERLYTNYGGIKLRLAKGDEVVDQRGECIFVPGNDRARLFADYTPSMWPGTAPLDDVPAMNRRLEDMGIRASVIATAGHDLYEQYLACGISPGGSWLGASMMHGGSSKSKNRVRQPNFNTSEWRASAPKRIAAVTAKRARLGLHQQGLCDEPGLNGMTSSDEFDAHPENLVEYRRRMEAKYGTIAEYNRRHRTDHKSFADVGEGLMADARASGNFAEFIEWRNFNVDRWCEAIRLISDASHAGDPDAPFSMCETFGPSALTGNDYWKLLTRAGLGISQEYTSMVYFGRDPMSNIDEVYRSFRPDMRVWGWTGYFYTADRAKFMPWWFAAHRFGGFSWYAATAPGYNLIDPDTFALTIDGRDLQASLDDSRLLNGLGRAFLEYDWAKRDVAICWSHDSLLLATIRGPETKNREIAANSPLHDYLHSRLNAQYLVEDLLYQHDYVAPEQMLTGKLAGYKVLLMPRINAMSDAEVAAVKEFLAKGGRVVADELPGAWDELGVPREQNPFEGVDGMFVYGRNFDDLNREQRFEALRFLDDVGAGPVLRSATIADVFGREAMHFTDGVNDVFPILRHPGRSQDDEEETFVFPRGGFVWDVRACRALGKTDRVTTKVPRAGAAVYAVLQYEAKGVSISAPDAAKAGSVLSADVRLDAAGAPVGTHVYNVRFVPPSGECRFHFRRNVTAKGGVARVDFPLALNDERGAWKVVAEDAFTGLRAERVVVVE